MELTNYLGEISFYFGSALKLKLPMFKISGAIDNSIIPVSPATAARFTETTSDIWNILESSNVTKVVEVPTSSIRNVSICTSQTKSSFGFCYNNINLMLCEISELDTRLYWSAIIKSDRFKLGIGYSDVSNTYGFINLRDNGHVLAVVDSFGYISDLGLVKTPTEFKVASPVIGYPIRRGDSVEFSFSEAYNDGTVVTPAPYTLLTKPGVDKYGKQNWTISGNVITVTEECWNSAIFIIAKPTDTPNLTATVSLTVLDPVFPPSSPNPYLPPDGGISGGGNQSDISTVPGTFDGQPGPTIVENIPNGSSGSDIASSGMYTKYLCNNALLDLLAEFFWEDNVGIQILKTILGNPIDSIISLAAYPFALETLVPITATTIHFGQYDSHISAFSLTKSSFQIDWGTVTIPFFWGSFLDYSPYTKIQLYLPWGVGFVSIDPNEVVPWSRKNTFNKADFVNGTIRVITNIELDKGACVHNVVGNNGRIIGSFGGIVGKKVPVTGSDNSARIIAMISAATSSSAGSAIQSLTSAVVSPPSYPRAGTFSDATNTLGYQYPYLIISRPSQSVPMQYGRFMGYPSNIFHAHLGEVRGYTEVSSIHLDKIAATANELDELESILKGGVLL